MQYLLSNNMPFEDREDFARLFSAHYRAAGLAMAAGCWLALESVCRIPAFKKMAIGWRVCSFAGLAVLYKEAFNAWNARTYGPLMGAYLRKYSGNAAGDTFSITDRKREFYEIDTSQYMGYDEHDLPHGHVNHGPQPDGEALDSTWLTELDNFLNNREHHLKEHRFFHDYEYQFIDKSFPSAEMAADLIHKH